MADPTRADTVRVTDPQALRAMAHPLRLRLLGLLRLDGPSTATLLGRRLGESSGATSYHLRELARYGFVGELPGRGTGRERWWQAQHRMTAWDAGDFAGEGSEVAAELERQIVALRGRHLSAWLTQRDALPPDWDGAGELSDWGVRLTADETRAMGREVGAVLDRWSALAADRDPPAGSERVRVHLDVLPMQDWPV